MYSYHYHPHENEFENSKYVFALGYETVANNQDFSTSHGRVNES